MGLVWILAAMWTAHGARCSAGQDTDWCPPLHTSKKTEHTIPDSVCGAGSAWGKGSEDARIQRELEIMRFYGCVLSAAEHGSMLPVVDLENDTVEMHAKMFHEWEYRAGKISRSAIVSEIVVGTRFAEVRRRALASAVYLSNRRGRCIERLPQIFKVLGDRKSEVIMLASSSMGVGWLSDALLSRMRNRGSVLCPYVAAKEYLKNGDRGKRILRRLRRKLRNTEPSCMVHLVMQRLILETIGMCSSAKIIKLQKCMGAITATSISRYLNANMVWITELVCKLCPKKMEDVCKDHEWSADELRLVVEGYYPQILRRMPLETLVAYLMGRRGEQQRSLRTLPAVLEAIWRISAAGRGWCRILDVASEGDLALLDMLEGEKSDALQRFFSNRDNLEDLESSGLRRWVLMTRGPETVRLVLRKMAEAGVLAGKTLDMDETDGVLGHEQEDILQLVRDGGARLRLSPAGLWNMDREMLEAVERSSALGILGIEHNIATIKILGDRHLWPLIEHLKAQAGPECAAEIDTLVLSMSKDVAGKYRSYLRAGQSAKRMRTEAAPVWTTWDNASYGEGCANEAVANMVRLDGRMQANGLGFRSDSSAAGRHRRCAQAPEG